MGKKHKKDTNGKKGPNAGKRTRVRFQWRTRYGNHRCVSVPAYEYFAFLKGFDRNPLLKDGMDELIVYTVSESAGSRETKRARILHRYRSIDELRVFADTERTV